MKSINKLGIIILSLIIMLGSLQPSFFVAYAEVIENSEVGIEDFYLYNALLDMANEGRQEDDYLFKLETDSLLSVTEIILIDSNILSLNGLEQLDLSNLLTLDLSFNNLESVDAETLSSMPNLQTLNLSSTGLEQLDISGLLNPSTLILNNNKLQTLDVSRLTYLEGVGQGYANLSNNHFTALDDLTLPTTQVDAIQVDILNNLITDYDPQALTAYHNIELLFQGVVEGQILKESEELIVADSVNYVGYNIKIYNEENDQLVNTLGQGQSLNLIAGSYYLKHFLLEEELYDPVLQTPVQFKGVSFSVMPEKPQIAIMVGEEVLQDTTVISSPATILLSSINPQAIFYYSVDNGEWLEGSTINLDSNGTFSFRVKVIVGEVESDVEAFTLKVQIMSEVYLGILKATAMILIFILILFGIYVFYNKKIKPLA